MTPLFEFRIMFVLFAKEVSYFSKIYIPGGAFPRPQPHHFSVLSFSFQYSLEGLLPPSYPQPQSSHCFLGAVALLVSVDSFGSLPASQDSPLGYLFPRSPPTSYFLPVLNPTKANASDRECCLPDKGISAPPDSNQASMSQSAKTSRQASPGFTSNGTGIKTGTS